MRSLLVTGGGHVNFFPGLQTIRNAERLAGNIVLASLDGWKGIDGKRDGVVDITDIPVDSLRTLGGSFIGSSRTKPEHPDVVARNIRDLGINVVYAFGGDDTHGVSNTLHKYFGIPIVGWPKTMDNDTKGSYSTIGYETAAAKAAKETLESIANAYTHSRIVLLPMFGRNFDWIVAAAADYGHADYVVTAERKDMELSTVVNDIISVYRRNQERYGKPFAVVVVSEGACRLDGIKKYFRGRIPETQEYQKDDFENIKLDIDVLGLALKDALAEEGIKGENVALKPLTYHLRDPQLIPIGEQFARLTAETCLKLARGGNFGRVATVQDPAYSGIWPSDERMRVETFGGPLVVDSVPVELASQKRPLRDTGFFDYETLRPTPEMTRFLQKILGPKPEDPRNHIINFYRHTLN